MRDTHYSFGCIVFRLGRWGVRGEVGGGGGGGGGGEVGGWLLLNFTGHSAMPGAGPCL